MGRVLFLDRDGTLIEDVGYISDYTNIVVKQGVFQGLSLLIEAGFKFVIVSNQSGVARKLISEKEFQQVNRTFIKIFTDHAIKFEIIYYCFHLPSDNCLCRKPKIAFFNQAKACLGSDFVSAMVGDSIVDEQFAQNSQIPFYTTSDIFGYPKYANFADIAQAISKELVSVE